jgi:hypothetical protein
MKTNASTAAVATNTQAGTGRPARRSKMPTPSSAPKADSADFQLCHALDDARSVARTCSFGVLMERLRSSSVSMLILLMLLSIRSYHSRLLPISAGVNPNPERHREHIVCEA